MPPVPDTADRHFRLAVLVVAVAVVAAYWPALHNGPVWDDQYLVTENPYLQSWDGLKTLWTSDLWTASHQQQASSYYRPLSMTTYWLTARVTGLTPESVRAWNILLHILNAVLLIRLMNTLLPARHPMLATLLGTAWALAPLCSEPVIWLSGRFDLLVGLFALLAVSINQKPGRWAALGVSVVVGLGLLSKENFLGWTPLLLIDDFVLHRRRLRDVAGKWGGIVLVAAAYLALRASLHLKSVSILSDHDAGTLIEAYLFAVGLFLSLLMMPTRLDPFHPYTGLPAARLFLTGALVVAVTLLSSSRGLRRNASTGARLSLTGWLWFLGALVPSALTGPTLMMIGDRYAYLPLIGLFLALWPLVAWLDHRCGVRTAHLLAAALAGLIVIEAGVTAARAPDWKDDRSLAEASLRSHPGGFYALYTLGRMAAEAGDLDRASALLRRSLAANEGSWRTWDAMCFVLLHQRHLEEARDACLISARIHPSNPPTWVNLSSVYVETGEWSRAYAAAIRALTLKPQYVNARYLAAAAAANLGRLAEAETHIEAGLAIDPANARLLALKAALDAAQDPRQAGQPSPP